MVSPGNNWPKLQQRWHGRPGLGASVPGVCCPDGGRSGRPILDLEIACGPGTYIRSIARDLGAAAGTGGALAQLQRTASCGFRLQDSLSLEELAAALEGDRLPLTEPNDALRHLPTIQLSEPLVALWLNGRRLPLAELGDLEPGIATAPSVRIQDPAGTFLGIAAIALDAEPALLVPKLVFN